MAPHCCDKLDHIHAAAQASGRQAESLNRLEVQGPILRSYTDLDRTSPAATCGLINKLAAGWLLSGTYRKSPQNLLA